MLIHFHVKFANELKCDNIPLTTIDCTTKLMRYMNFMEGGNSRACELCNYLRFCLSLQCTFHGDIVGGEKVPRTRFASIVWTRRKL